MTAICGSSSDQFFTSHLNWPTIFVRPVLSVRWPIFDDTNFSDRKLSKNCVSPFIHASFAFLSISNRAPIVGAVVIGFAASMGFVGELPHAAIRIPAAINNANLVISILRGGGKNIKSFSWLQLVASKNAYVDACLSSFREARREILSHFHEHCARFYKI